MLLPGRWQALFQSFLLLILPLKSDCLTVLYKSAVLPELLQALPALLPKRLLFLPPFLLFPDTVLIYHHHNLKLPAQTPPGSKDPKYFLLKAAFPRNHCQPSHTYTEYASSWLHIVLLPKVSIDRILPEPFRYPLLWLPDLLPGPPESTWFLPVPHSGC